MDIFKLFLATGLMGKFVLLFLLGMSFISWYYIFFNLIRLRDFDQKVSQSLNELEWSSSIDRLSLRKISYTNSDLTKMVDKLIPHLMDPRVKGNLTREDLQTLARIERDSLSLSLTKGLGYLATCASTAPFIGLFGTVWGIMKAFHDIGLKGSASLTTVAPGIAEALVNTAMGLLVAIPASMAYNYFVLKKQHLTQKLDIFIQKLLLLSGESTKP